MQQVEEESEPTIILENFTEISEIGKTPNNGVNRLTLTAEDCAARRLLISWVESEQLGDVTFDDMGNIYVTSRSGDRRLPEIIVGSHLDSVPFGGRFDGVLGVLGGLEVLRVLKKKGSRHPIRLAVFTNEEGSRFQPSIIGSGVVAGVYDIGFAYLRIDDKGTTFKTALEASGFLGERANRPKNVRAYFELHIEQGPELERSKIQIGIPTAIATLVALKVTVRGESNHAGPTPMNLRHDALVASSKMIVSIQDFAFFLRGKGVMTVGRISISPNVYNAVPGLAKFTVDIRSPDLSVVRKCREYIDTLAEQVGKEQGVSITIDQLWEAKRTDFDEGLVNIVESEAKRIGYSSMRMLSWAGHDAQMMAKIAPTAMIFIPCKGGRTHCEEEYASPEDIVRGTQVLINTVLSCDRQL
jgi:N-carbamoyl-L-amino-acid hydrolase